MQEKQTKILQTFLELLNKGGKFNTFTLASAGASLDISKGEMDLLFPYGLFEICEKLWQVHLDELTPFISKEGGVTLGVKNAIKQSFTLLAPNKRAMICIFKFLLLPQNILFTPKFLWQFADRIWSKLEGGNAGFSYYTKRASLASIYSNCFIYFITSKNHTKLDVIIEKQISFIINLAKKFKK